jgi:hypothetical protein
VPYEFSGLYMFGLPLPALDDDIVKSPKKAIPYEFTELDGEVPAPFAEALAAVAPQS